MNLFSVVHLCVCLGKIVFYKLSCQCLILNGTAGTFRGQSVEVSFQALPLVYVQNQISAQLSEPWISLKKKECSFVIPLHVHAHLVRQGTLFIAGVSNTLRKVQEEIKYMW